MKKSLFCLGLAALLLLSACGQAPAAKQEEPAARHESGIAPAQEKAPAQTTEENTVQESSESTPEPTPEPTPMPEPVYTAYDWEGDYTDGVGNESHYRYRIPAFSFGQERDTVNAEIYDFYMRWIKDDLDNIEENKGYSILVYTADYAVYINGDLVSLLCGIHNDWGQSMYLAATLDAATGLTLSRSDLLAAAGLDEDGFRAKAEEALRNNAGDIGTYPEEARSFAAQQLEKTLSDENLADTELFFNADGTLCMIVKIYSIAGADYYWHTIEL